MSHRVTELHNIMPIANIPSVLQYGILSHEKCSKMPHTDVSLAAVQDKRDTKHVPGGLKLHQYTNLYFDARNPMMYIRHSQAQDLCVLRISTQVLQIQGAVITDQNAASDYVRFLPPNCLNYLDFDLIFAEDWRHPNDYIAYLQHKSAKCAEVLVPHGVDIQYITGAYVLNDIARNKLKNFGFFQVIDINRRIFFS